MLPLKEKLELAGRHKKLKQNFCSLCGKRILRKLKLENPVCKECTQMKQNNKRKTERAKKRASYLYDLV